MPVFIEPTKGSQFIPFFHIDVIRKTATLEIPERHYDNFQDLLGIFASIPGGIATVITDTYTYIFHCPSLKESKELEDFLFPVLSEMLERNCSVERCIELAKYMEKYDDIYAYKVKGNLPKMIEQGAKDVKEGKIKLKTKEELLKMKTPDVKIPKLKKKSLTKGNAFLV